MGNRRIPMGIRRKEELLSKLKLSTIFQEAKILQEISLENCEVEYDFSGGLS